MTLELSGRVGPVNYHEGESNARARFTNDGGLATQPLHGTYFEATLRGRVFSQAATPLGLAIPIYTATAIAGAMPIWNPPNSGVNVAPLFVDLGYGSGTAVYGSIGLMARKLKAIATGELMTALADTAPINGLLFGGLASKVMSSNAGTCTVTAGVAADWVRTLASINLEATTGTAHGTLIVHYDFGGSLVVPPGTLVYLACTLATAALYASCLVWEEIVLP